MSFIKRKAGSIDVVKSVLEFDDVPTEGSHNLLESGSVAQAIGNLGQPLQWKGPATVTQLNAGITGIQPGWTYTLTDAGTLTDGSIVVDVGDEVAWTEDGEWFQVGPSLVELKADVVQAKSDIADIQDVVPEEASESNKLVTKDELDNVQESIQSGFTPKGEISVSDLNDLTTQSNGDQYILTDSGTITDGSVTVEAGDSVAWNSTDSVWYKVKQYALSKYGTDEIKNLQTSITAFRTGDVIPVDGPSGTAKMTKDNLLKETAQNALVGNVAKEFSTGSYYIIGEKVAYNGKRYFFKSNHSAGSWNPAHVYEDKYLASTTLIKEIFDSTSTIYFGNFKAGDTVHFSFSSSDWVNTSGSAAIVIACFKSDGGYAYYKTYTDRTALLNKGFDLLVPSNSLYVSLTLRVDVGYSVVTEVKNNGAVRLYGYVGDVQGDDLFEMGNISMSSSGNSYEASTKRVRTKTTFKAYAGDKIIADADIVFYVNTKPVGSNTWNPVGWNSGEFIVDSDCDICLLFRFSTETTTSVAEICSKFVIYSSRSSFTAASRVVRMFNTEPEFAEVKRTLVFTGAGNTIQRVSFNVVGGKIYKFDIPAFSAAGVSNMYLLYGLDFGSDSSIYNRGLKTNDSVSARTIYLYIPIGITSVRFSLRAAVGEKVVISVSEYERQNPPVVNTPVVRNVNHRGCQQAVENTIPAYILSAAYGYNIVETDVRATSDGKFVCLHDATVDSLSNGTGYIASMTLAQAKALSFAKTRPSYFSATKIATLSEVLAICKQLGLKLYVDIKIGATYAEAIADEVNSFGMIDDVSFIRGDKAALLAIKTKYPAARVGYLAGDITSEIVSDILSLSTDEGHRDIFIDSNKDVITSAGLALAEAENVPVELWVKDDIDFTTSPSVSGVTSNSVIPPSIPAAENVFANVMQV